MPIDDSLVRLFDSIFVISHDPIYDRRSSFIYVHTHHRPHDTCAKRFSSQIHTLHDLVGNTIPLTSPSSAMEALNRGPPLILLFLYRIQTPRRQRQMHRWYSNPSEEETKIIRDQQCCGC